MAQGGSIRVAVLGAGAVGCYYGGMLARAGHEVTLIGRPVHVDAFKARGLRFPRLGRAAEAYAGRQAVYPLGSAQELRALFEEGGFDIESLTQSVIDPDRRQAFNVPTVPSGDSYAQLVAVRR